MTSLIENITFILAFVSIGTAIAIPLIKWLAAQTRSERIKQVELWALQVVKNVNGIASTLAGPEKKAEAVKQLQDILERSAATYDVSTDDLLRYVESAYETSKNSNTLTVRKTEDTK